MKYGKLTWGQMETIVNKLGGMDGVKKLLRGEVEMVAKKHIIDLDAPPFVPEGLEVVDHIKGGQFEWSLDKVALHLDEAQKSGSIKGNELLELLKDKPVLNACVLDYLLEHPELIPESWKSKFVYFWGTIYRSSRGLVFVRGLSWDGDRWAWDYDWLGRPWDGRNPAALLRVFAGGK